MAETDNRIRLDDVDLPEHLSREDVLANRFTQKLLENHKREGLAIAVKARWIALAAVSVLIVFLNPAWEMLWYHALLLLIAAMGWLQQRVGEVGLSRRELLVLFLDLTLFVFVLVFPNPFAVEGADRPTAYIYRFENFQYLFILLALATLSYSWRTIWAVGNWTAMIWFIAFALVWWFGHRVEDLTLATQEAFGEGTTLSNMLDPNALQLDMRVQQAVVFMIVAGILAVTVRRFNRLLISTAALQRERANLSRYFSPNVVQELSQNDEPLKQIRSHDVAILFVDIRGFTGYAADRDPEEIITTLREFHRRMEHGVFAHEGTLDKFLGDGLMASFGTPLPGPDDAQRAVRCGRSMLSAAEAWNTEREKMGEPPLRIGIGIDYGPTVLGDIGENRLEFAVVGSAVNIASRLEGLTRDLDVSLVISQQVFDALPPNDRQGFEAQPKQQIRGVGTPVSVWTLA